MQLFNIFTKNLKTISRNSSYFFILVFFPLFLILISGTILSSINVNNVDIMFSTDDYSQDISGFEDFQKYFTYAPLDYCLEKLEISEVGACIYLESVGSSQILNVYYDGSNKFIEQYTRQLVLDKVSKKQSEILEETSETISENILSYKVLFSETKDKLISTRDELVSQKSDLIARKAEVEELRVDYLQIYYSLKSSEDEFFSTKAAIEKNKDEIDADFNSLKSGTTSMKNYISSLRSTGLMSTQEYYVSQLENYVSEVDSFLDLYEETYGSDLLINVLNGVARMYEQLDEIKDILDGTIKDLDNSILRIDSTIMKINDYLEELDEYSSSLDELSDKTSYNEFSWNFISGISTEDPILLSFPLLVSIIIMFTSLVLPNMITSKQTHENSYLRERISPIKAGSFLFADYITNLFFIFIQAVVLFLVGVIWVGIPFSSGGLFFFGTFLVSTLFIFIGMTISYRIRNSSLSSLITVFLVMLFLIVSDIIASPLLTSSAVNFLMNMNPFVIFLNFLKEIFVLNNILFHVLGYISKFIFYILIFCFVLFSSKKKHDKKIGG